MKRKFEVLVRNGHGDEATVMVEVRCDRHVGQYVGPAILKAKRVLPDQKPWQIGPWQEIA